MSYRGDSPAWTWQRVAKLKRLWATDMARKEVARELGTSVGYVYRKARAIGIEPPHDMPRWELEQAAPPPKREMPAYDPPQGWPTKAQLMAGR